MPNACPAATAPAQSPGAKALPALWGTQTSPTLYGGAQTTIAVSQNTCEGTPVSLLAGMLLHPPQTFTVLRRTAVQTQQGCVVTGKR